MSLYDYDERDLAEDWSEYMSEHFYNTAKELVGENPYASELIECMALAISTQEFKGFKSYQNLSYDHATNYLYQLSPSITMKVLVDDLYCDYIRNEISSQYYLKEEGVF